MKLIEKFIEKAKKQKRKIVFPEGTDERILQAVVVVKRQGIAVPVLVGRPEDVKSLAKEKGIEIEDIEIIEPVAYPEFSRLVDLYIEKRKRVSRKVAEKLLRKELVFGGMLVAAGKVDGMVAGAASTTGSVIQAAGLTVGFQKGISTPSSFFIMVMPDGRVLFYADCAVNVNPDASQLADIGIATAMNYSKIMADEPRVAFLSFSTKGSASHPMVEKVAEALKTASEKNAEFLFDGEFQADTALSEKVAKKKVKGESEVAGRANVLVFPDLNAGNISYKLTQYLAGAEAYGPILQGFAGPVSDLSRGANVEDIIGVTAITCLQK
jgi:phosphate acetyltransferase